MNVDYRLISKIIRWLLAGLAAWAAWTVWNDLPHIRETGNGGWAYYSNEFRECLVEFTRAGERVRDAVISRFESMRFTATQTETVEKGRFVTLESS